MYRDNSALSETNTGILFQHVFVTKYLCLKKEIMDQKNVFMSFFYFNVKMVLFCLWCVMQLSTIFQFYEILLKVSGVKHHNPNNEYYSVRSELYGL
jgi:hypothetical protein